MNFLVCIIVFLLQTHEYTTIGVTAMMGDKHQAITPILNEEISPNNKHQQPQLKLPPYPAHLNPSNGSWQPINGTTHKYFVFSAFFDNRFYTPLIRVVAATRIRKRDQVWCRYWYHTQDQINNRRYVSHKARVKIIRENWRMQYSACYILCPLLQLQQIPEAVSIVTKVKSPPSNLLSVINNKNGYNPIYKFAVCVKPIHNTYNKVLQILEFIELNRILGVEHFTFYNHTVGKQVGCILNDYVERGLVTLLPWQLDLVSQKEIRTEGMFAALNDCLYRSMHVFTHVLFIDFDEYIIPRDNATLVELIEYLDSTLTIGNTGSYSFQNAFFYLQWEDDASVYESRDAVEAGLVTLKKTRRRSSLHPHMKRSKYICRPELVVETGNHFVWEFLDWDYGVFKTPASVAMLHHYRVCEFGGNVCIKKESTVDKTAYKYKELLVDAVREKFNYLKQKCNL